MNNKWQTIPTDEIIKKTSHALTQNGISPLLVQNGIKAKETLIDMIPPGSSVMNGTSTTLQQIGVVDHLKTQSQWKNLHVPILGEKDQEKKDYLYRASSTADYFLGSVHAVTEDGTVVIASNSGSQLPGYAFAAKHVIWVVGTHKIVKNLDEAFKRIYDYILPLESTRANKAYHMTEGSFVSKMLIINREKNPERIKLMFVNEVLGY